jgi:8-oxo-dGTP pyrophosphatase MutT (NUDIX family)
MIRIAVALLVDPQGRVLLQERDEGAPRAANQWGMVGGHVEDGEDFDTAVVREIEEETGLTVPGDALSLWFDGEFRYSDADEAFAYHVYAGATDATDADIVVGEGRQIVFVEPGSVPGLDKSESCAHFVPRFLASPAYRTLLEDR